MSPQDEHKDLKADNESIIDQKNANEELSPTTTPPKEDKPQYDPVVEQRKAEQEFQLESNEPIPVKHFQAGPEHKLNDPKDNRSLTDRVAAELEVERLEKLESENAPRLDPLEPARSHGNEPSRGARIDAELQHDDEMRIQEMEQSKVDKANNSGKKRPREEDEASSSE